MTVKSLPFLCRGCVCRAGLGQPLSAPGEHAAVPEPRCLFLPSPEKRHPTQHIVQPPACGENGEGQELTVRVVQLSNEPSTSTWFPP